MPLFALEQIVLLSFAERERAADARLHVYARKTETCAILWRQEGQREEHDRPVLSILAFSGLFCSSALVMLGASSCTLILTLITGADTMARTAREDATNSWRCNRDPRTDSRIASGDS